MPRPLLAIRHVEAHGRPPPVEFAALVDEVAPLEWLHGELDYLSPSGYEERYRQTQIESVEAA